MINMSELEIVAGGRHFSYSALTSFMRCGKAYELERKRKVPHPPAWWLIGGTAVHQATADLDERKAYPYADAELERTWNEAFYAVFDENQDEWPNSSEWVMAGRYRHDSPFQGFDHWKTRGLAYVRNYQDFRMNNPWMRMLEIEYDLSYVWQEQNPWGEQIAVKAFADRVFLDERDGTLGIMDLKTGSSRPESTLQLDIYLTLARQHERFEDAVKGCFLMIKDGKIIWTDSKPLPLETLKRLGLRLAEAEDFGVYLPHLSSACGATCLVKDSCFLYSGSTGATRMYDSLDPNYVKEGAHG